MPKRGIALIGMPGSGKTSVGRRLAEKLGREWCDTDTLIEQTEGKTIPELFDAFGEAGFRIKETAAVDLATRRGGVISCGGGVVVTPGNVELLRTRCYVVYLSALPSTLTARVERGQNRPLLAGDAAQKVVRLLAERKELYRAACHREVAVDDRGVEEIADEIAAAAKEQIV